MQIIKINNQELIGVKGYKIAQNKLWKNSNRNMAGELTASLVGIFPKIELKFRLGLTQQQVSSLIAKLNQPTFNVTYYDPQTNSMRTAEYYASDYDIELLDAHRNIYKEFSVNLIPIRRI